jgi:hypothetical protein
LDTVRAHVVLVALVGQVPEEIDILAHAIDEIGIAAISFIVLILIAVWRKKITHPGRKKRHNIISVLFVVAFLFEIYAFTVEKRSIGLSAMKSPY